jgi:broad specificity phosphatase PhoE
MKKYLLLVRHSESYNNVRGNKFSGIMDTPLTEEGYQQARRLAIKLSDCNIEVVLTSKLERARKTAELIFPNVPLRVSNELLEFDYGKYDGISPEDLPPNDPIINQWKRLPGNLSFPGGQNISKYAEEMWHKMHDLIRSTNETKIGCIIHKTMARLFVAKILQIDLNCFRLIPMDNCSISVIIWDSKKGFELKSLNIIDTIRNDYGEEIWNL